MHHPDRGGDPDKCREINAAYEILSDPDKRAHYDRTGDTEHRPKQTAAHSIIAAMVAEAFSQDSTDAIRYMKERIDARRADHQAQRDRLESGAKKLRKKIEKFGKCSESTENTEGREFVAEVLTAGLLDIERAIEQHNCNIENLTESLALLNGLKGGDAVDLANSIYRMGPVASAGSFYGSTGW